MSTAVEARLKRCRRKFEDKDDLLARAVSMFHQRMSTMQAQINLVARLDGYHRYQQRDEPSF